MKLKIRAIYVVAILAIAIISDQLTKAIAQANLENSQAISFLHDFFVLTYAENTGGFLGMGAAINESIRFWIFSVSVGLFLTAMFFFLIFTRSISNGQVFVLTTILGGGVGNLIDRIMYDGRVVDFMNMGIGPVRTGIFNVADLYITFGAIFLFFSILIESKNKQAKETES